MNKVFVIEELDIVDGTLIEEGSKLFQDFYVACNYLVGRGVKKRIQDLSPSNLAHKYVFITDFRKFILRVYTLK